MSAPVAIPHASRVRDRLKKKQEKDKQRSSLFKRRDRVGDKKPHRQRQYPEQEVFNQNADCIKALVDSHWKKRGGHQIDRQNEQNLNASMPDQQCSSFIHNILLVERGIIINEGRSK